MHVMFKAVFVNLPDAFIYIIAVGVQEMDKLEPIIVIIQKLSCTAPEVKRRRYLDPYTAHMRQIIYHLSITPIVWKN